MKLFVYAFISIFSITIEIQAAALSLSTFTPEQKQQLLSACLGQTRLVLPTDPDFSVRSMQDLKKDAELALGRQRFHSAPARLETIEEEIEASAAQGVSQECVVDEKNNTQGLGKKKRSVSFGGATTLFFSSTVDSSMPAYWKKLMQDAHVDHHPLLSFWQEHHIALGVLTEQDAQALFLDQSGYKLLSKIYELAKKTGKSVNQELSYKALVEFVPYAIQALQEHEVYEQYRKETTIRSCEARGAYYLRTHQEVDTFVQRKREGWFGPCMFYVYIAAGLYISRNLIVKLYDLEQDMIACNEKISALAVYRPYCKLECQQLHDVLSKKKKEDLEKIVLYTRLLSCYVTSVAW